VFQLPLSSLQAKLEPGSLEEKVKLAPVEAVLVAGPLAIEVCGAVVSSGGSGTLTVQLSVAGVASTLPAASVARAEKVCAPVARPE
jgi:hypothetical protein